MTGEGLEEGKEGKDLLPTVKKNFNARRTLHAAIDTIRAINQLRAGNLAAAAGSMMNKNRAAGANSNSNSNNNDGNENKKHDGGTVDSGIGHGSSEDMMDGIEKHKDPVAEDVNQGMGQLPMDVDGGMGFGGVPRGAMDPRGDARGQTQAMIHEQQRRINEVTNGLWQARH